MKIVKRDDCNFFLCVFLYAQRTVWSLLPFANYLSQLKNSTDRRPYGATPRPRPGGMLSLSGGRSGGNRAPVLSLGDNSSWHGLINFSLKGPHPMFSPFVAPWLVSSPNLSACERAVFIMKGFSRPLSLSLSLSLTRSDSLSLSPPLARFHPRSLLSSLSISLSLCVLSLSQLVHSAPAEASRWYHCCHDIQDIYSGPRLWCVTHIVLSTVCMSTQIEYKSPFI